MQASQLTPLVCGLVPLVSTLRYKTRNIGAGEFQDGGYTRRETITRRGLVVQLCLVYGFHVGVFGLIVMSRNTTTVLQVSSRLPLRLKVDWDAQLSRKGVVLRLRSTH